MSEDRSDDEMLSDAQLDGLLDRSPELAPSADLMRRVAQIPLAHDRTEGALDIWPFASLWRALVSASLAVSLGALSGMLVVPQEMLEDGDPVSMFDEDDGWELETLEGMR